MPTLVMSMTCHYLMMPDEIIFDHFAAKEQLVLVEGATHGFTRCRPEIAVAASSASITGRVA